MPYTTNYNVIPNQEIYNYIEDVNYGMSKPWSHCVVTSNFTVGDISAPVDFYSYYRKEKCEKYR